jgi:putative hydrolase of the HAD superfamily
MPVTKLSGLAVLVFDLDDTLYLERDFAFSGFEAVGRWLQEQLKCPTDPVPRMKALFESDSRNRVFNQLLAEWQCSQSQIEAWVPLMVDCYRNHTPVIDVCADAAKAIDRWEKTFQLSLISDGPPRMQQNKIRALKLEDRFRPIILTDQWGESFRKPHPRAFHEVQNVTGHSGPECVYIADNHSKDFIAPRQLGWRTVCVGRKGGVYSQAVAPTGGSPEFHVSSLDELEIAT